ncbi:septum formation inhibitor Maf [Kangiella profundi]|uniref:7-methyl-GTP pyrophosphatase n=2 Tax=Kangiella profundi TaxID=1561924 RepID=A0A2K9A4J6_9GAMM|nr:Maf family protein [Kangiella profundi]AUD78765.1 septum formation inhibitor Maf [Kangiella profundi]GGF04411.1 Maf-like protein [Kangiella profundi]
MPQPHIILASSSPYRKELLSRILDDFDAISPDIDETPFPDEEPIELVARLAQQKALAIAINHPDALVVGSDQVCVLNNQILGKPGTMDKAIEQLQACSGQTVTFYTSLCVTNANETAQNTTVVATKVLFRQLTETEIINYLEKEQPLDCAGSFKCEGLGIVLFEAIESKDPTALIGLPLIALATKLREFRVELI